MSYSSLLSNLCISEVNSVNTYTARPANYPMKNSGRRHCGLLYTLEGTETYHFHDKSIAAAPHSLLFIPQNEKYTITLQGEQSVVKGINFELVSDDIPRPFCMKLRKNSALLSCFTNAEKIWFLKKSAYSIECKACFYQIVAQAVKWDNSHLTSQNYSKIAAAVNYIHEHYTEPDFRIEKLVEISKFSSKYLNILFLQEFHISPKEYVTALKMERAKELLSNEKNTIGDIAFQLGYSDIYHFSKIFKSKTGYTPSEYRTHQYSPGEP